MHIKRTPSWTIAESEATDEALFFSRRALLGGTAAAGAAAILLPRRTAAAEADPTADLYPARRNAAFALDREVTPEAINTTYNNFYEFGSTKAIARAAEKLPIRPWTIAIDGLVEAKKTVDIDSFIRSFALEERLYRHRCVEAWSMSVPWTGIPLKDVVAWAKPLGSAKYVAFQTFGESDVASGLSQIWYPWPYTEGLTIAEATSELPLLVTGAYGKPVAKSMGAPIRLAVPWKYGFKSIKSIVRIAFVEERPKTFWEALQSSEYGFWANVNPEVAHPRWSQAEERVLGTDEVRPTLLFNGYGEQVAGLYKGLEGEALYM